MFALLFAFLLGPGFSAGDFRLIAEWEPALGSCIAWPLDIPCELVQELAKDDRVWVLVANSSAQREALAAFTDWHIPASQIIFIQTSTESSWTRDYGAHQIFDRDGHVGIVDPIYIDTPGFLQKPPSVKRGDKLDYRDTFPGDDRTNEDLAAALGLKNYPMEAYLTGGNFLVDGAGTAFVTRAMLDENNVLMSDEAFRAMVAQFTGVGRIIVLENMETYGIQHIDCFIKILDPETILVKRVPKSHPEYAPIERNVALLAKLKSCFGRPYRIARIECPVYGKKFNKKLQKLEDMVPAYTNSLILNKKVLVPLFLTASDSAALATYRELMPGYQVVGIPYPRWFPGDALHCRTRAIFNTQMINLTHPAIRDGQPAGTPIPLTLYVENHLGRAVLLSASAFWRVKDTNEWQEVSLEPQGTTWTGNLPGAAKGSVIEYYLQISGGGLTETNPRTAPEGLYQFQVAP